jgi:hypothetical protein
MSSPTDLLAIARVRLHEVRSEGAAAGGAAALTVGTGQATAREISERSEETRATLLIVSQTQSLGEAGPGVPAWLCAVDRGTGHVMGTRADGSTFCATCHPGAIAVPRPSST